MRSTLLQLIGFRTYCCDAKVVAWSRDKFVCATCKKPVTQASRAAARQQLRTKKRSAFQLLHRSPKIR